MLVLAKEHGKGLEQVILRMHSFGNFMSATLQDHTAQRGEVNANVCPVEFLLHN